MSAFRNHRRQHTVRFYPAVYHILKERSVISRRAISGDVDHMLSLFFMSPQDYSKDDLVKMGETVGTRGQPLVAQYPLRIPVALSDLIMERARTAGHSFNQEINEIILSALAKQRYENDALINEFKARLRRNSLPQPEQPDVSMSA